MLLQRADKMFASPDWVLAACWPDGPLEVAEADALLAKRY